MPASEKESQTNNLISPLKKQDIEKQTEIQSNQKKINQKSIVEINSRENRKLKENKKQKVCSS